MTVAGAVLVQLEGKKVKALIDVHSNIEVRNAEYQLSKMCERTDMFFIQKISNYPSEQNCWAVNHYILALTGSSIDHWSKAANFIKENGIEVPEPAIYTWHRYVKGQLFVEISYLYNPEFAGFARSPGSTWSSSEWHRARVYNDPEKTAYLSKVKAEGEKRHALIQEAFSSNPSFVTGQSSAVANSKPANASSKGANPPVDIKPQDDNVEAKLKKLKSLLDQSLIDQTDYERKKAEILKNM